MKNLKKQNKILMISVIILSVLVISAIISLGVRLGSSQTYSKLDSKNYVVGTLDNSGKFQKSGNSFVTEDYYTVDGLTITVKEKSNLSYKIYFYDEDKHYISNTNNFGVSYNGLIPNGAEYFKIVVEPTNDSDITLADIINYSSRIDVKFYK